MLVFAGEDDDDCHSSRWYFSLFIKKLSFNFVSTLNKKEV